MLKDLARLCLIAGFVTLTTSAAVGQEVVHALAGTVSSINPAVRTITITTDDGSDDVFKEVTSSHQYLDFSQRIRAHATPVGEFKDTGVHVIVYYFGGGFGTAENQTAVALQELGAKPLETSNGTVVKLDRHKHVLIIKNGSGAEVSYQIDDATVAETSAGAVEGDKYNPEKGDQVRVISTQADGNSKAMYIGAN